MKSKICSIMLSFLTVGAFAQDIHSGKVVGSFDYGNKDVTTIYDEVTGCERRTTPHEKGLFIPNENVEIIIDNKQLAEVVKPQMTEKVYTKKDCEIVVNPYDVYAPSIKPYYDQLNNIVALSDSISKDSLTALLLGMSNPSQYPEISTTAFTQKEKTYLTSLVSKINLGTYRSDKVLLKAQPVEQGVLSDATLSNAEKERLLNAISQLKYNLYYLGGVSNDPAGMSVASFEHWLDRCISDELDAIFNGNWIDIGLFVANPATGTLQIAASCAWDVAVGNYP